MPVAKEVRHVREEDRHVVGASLVHSLPRIGADEERLVAEVPVHLGSQVRARTLGVEVDERHVLELVCPLDERVQQDRWRGRAAMNEDLLAGSDARDGLGGGNDSHAASLGAGGTG